MSEKPILSNFKETSSKNQIKDARRTLLRWHCFFTNAHDMPKRRIVQHSGAMLGSEAAKYSGDSEGRADVRCVVL